MGETKWLFFLLFFIYISSGKAVGVPKYVSNTTIVVERYNILCYCEQYNHSISEEENP